MDLETLKIFKGKYKKRALVSNRYFTFIQIPKTSSTTVFCCCRQRGLIKKRVNCCHHEGLLYLENIIDTSLPVYAIVRNPFSHIHSYFFHQIKMRELTLDPKLSIISNFENFVLREINNVHLQQCRYLESNKGIKVKIFKMENNDFNDYLIQRHNLDLDLNNCVVNYNPKKNRQIPIISFFRNLDIVNLIVKERQKEFKEFGYSTDPNDLFQNKKGEKQESLEVCL